MIDGCLCPLARGDCPQHGLRKPPPVGDFVWEKEDDVRQVEARRDERLRSLETWRCPKCGRILAQMKLASGSRVVIKCQCNNFSERDV